MGRRQKDLNQAARDQANAKFAFEQMQRERDYWQGRAKDAEDVAQGMRRALSEPEPIPMFLTCPACGERHIDEGEFATRRHHTHSCQHCGLTWRPAVVPTVGVQFLPGFKSP